MKYLKFRGQILFLTGDTKMDTWSEKKREVKDDAKILMRLHEWEYVGDGGDGR